MIPPRRSGRGGKDAQAAAAAIRGGAIGGLAYGIFNEGILARTLLMSEGLPVPTFDHYLVAGGINFSWAITILVWHSIFSVGTPILIVHWLCPEVKQDSWLSKEWTIIALLTMTSTSCLFFREGRGTIGYYAIFVVAITGLLVVAHGFKVSTQSAWQFSWKPLLVGISTFTYFGQHGNPMDRMAKALNLTPAQQTQLTQMKANREATESGAGKAPVSTSPPGY